MNIKYPPFLPHAIYCIVGIKGLFYYSVIKNEKMKNIDSSFKSTHKFCAKIISCIF